MRLLCKRQRGLPLYSQPPFLQKYHRTLCVTMPTVWCRNVDFDLLQKLESYQAELAKRILRLPTFTPNNTALMALQWPSIRARILIKLCFLLKVVNSDLFSVLVSSAPSSPLMLSHWLSLVNVVSSSPSTSLTIRLL